MLELEQAPAYFFVLNTQRTGHTLFLKLRYTFSSWSFLLFVWIQYYFGTIIVKFVGLIQKKSSKFKKSTHLKMQAPAFSQTFSRYDYKEHLLWSKVSDSSQFLCAIRRWCLMTSVKTDLKVSSSLVTFLLKIRELIPV